jgi:adenosine 3'-phospho 5'-phosphosulfate transporter B3
MNNKEVYLFGIPLGGFSVGHQILILTVVVFIFEIGSGIVQEILFSFQKFPYEWFSTLVQFVIYAVCALLHNTFAPSSKPSNPKNKKSTAKTKTPYIGYASIAIASLLSRGLGNASFKHLDYGLKVMLASAKPVLVMVVGILLLRKRYTWRDYISTLLMILGLSGFSIADANGTGPFEIFGVLLMVGSLITDALKSTFQEAVMHDHGRTEVEVSLWSSVIGSILTLCVVIYTDQLWPGILYCIDNPDAWVLLTVLFIVGYIASIAVLLLIVVADAFTSSIISTARKAVTVFLSFLAFSKPFSIQHVVSVIAFFAGIAGHTTKTKNKKS